MRQIGAHSLTAGLQEHLDAPVSVVLRRALALLAGPEHLAVQGETCASAPIWRPTTAHTLVVPKLPALWRRQLGNDARVRSPFFSTDLLHHVDLEIAFGNQLLELQVLRFQLTQSLHVNRRKLPVAR